MMIPGTCNITIASPASAEPRAFHVFLHVFPGALVDVGQPRNLHGGAILMADRREGIRPEISRRPFGAVKTDGIPSGKSPFLMGKSTINGHFQ